MLRTWALWNCNRKVGVVLLMAFVGASICALTVETKSGRSLNGLFNDRLKYRLSLNFPPPQSTTLMCFVFPDLGKPFFSSQHTVIGPISRCAKPSRSSILVANFAVVIFLETRECKALASSHFRPTPKLTYHFRLSVVLGLTIVKMIHQCTSTEPLSNVVDINVLLFNRSLIRSPQRLDWVYESVVL